MTIASATPKRSLSSQQRLRALKFAIKDKMTELSQLAVIQAITSMIAAAQSRLKPISDLYDRYQQWWKSINEEYNQFIALETKEKWTWSKMYSKELAFLRSIPPYILMLGATLVYHTLLPVSFSFSLILPLYLAWGSWDRWWLSPMFIGTLLMAPLKFPPWGMIYFSWIWPGLI